MREFYYCTITARYHESSQSSRWREKSFVRADGQTTLRTARQSPMGFYIIHCLPGLNQLLIKSLLQQLRPWLFFLNLCCSRSGSGMITGLASVGIRWIISCYRSSLMYSVPSSDIRIWGSGYDSALKQEHCVQWLPMLPHLNQEHCDQWLPLLPYL